MEFDIKTLVQNYSYTIKSIERPYKEFILFPEVL